MKPVLNKRYDEELAAKKRERKQKWESVMMGAVLVIYFGGDALWETIKSPFGIVAMLGVGVFFFIL